MDTPEQKIEVSEEIKNAVNESSKYFTSSYSEYIFYQFYSRWIPELGRRETWIESIGRFMDYMKENLGDKLTEKEYEDVRQAIINQEICPSMRLLWSAGKACRQSNVWAYNCSWITPTCPQDLGEIMYNSMCGCGVGFAVEWENVQKFPQINKQIKILKNDIPIHLVEDSKEGWADAFVLAMTTWFEGKDIKFDYSKIRPAGARLETAGGKASGPQPLMDLMEFTKRKMLAKQGRRLSNLDLHDIICQIGLIVVAGGVRRSAMISLSELEDMEMRDAKKGQFYLNEPQRSMANNSAVYSQKPTAEEFLKEWTSLVESKSGERGIFNRGGLEKQVPARRWEMIKDEKQCGVNPCGEVILKPKQFCVNGDTKIITKDGIYSIKDLNNIKKEIWNGKKWSNVEIKKTGKNQKMVRVTLSDGSFLECTPDHRFSVKKNYQKEWEEIQAKDLIKNSSYAIEVEPTKIIPVNKNKKRLKDSYTLGFAVGDGCVYKNKVIIDLYGEKDFNCPISGSKQKIVLKKGYNIESRRVLSPVDPVLTSQLKTSADSLYALSKYNSNDILNFFAGWIDADGTNATGKTIRLYLSEEERAKAAQLLLFSCGIKSSVNLCQKAGVFTNKGKRKKDLWYLQIQDCSKIKTFRVDTSKTNKNRFKGKYQVIKSVVEIDGLHDSYCFNEPEEHKGLFGMCLTFQCNLTSIVIRPDDTRKTLERKMELATLLGTYQSTLTNFGYLSKKWKKNCDEERLLGVSLTGYYDNPIIRNDKILDDLRELAIETNQKYAKKFDINPSTAITCVKPHGNSGQLLGVGSGMHPWFAPYFIRRVRISHTDTLLKMARDQGIPCFPEVGQSEDRATTYVLEFPVKAPEGAIFKEDVSAIDLMIEWKRLKIHFTEHNPSVTIYVGPEEWLAVGNFVYENWDWIGGMSFLPRSDHIYQLAPYEAITKTEYEKRTKAIGKMDFSKLSLYESSDNTTGAKEVACSSGGTCDI